MDQRFYHTSEFARKAAVSVRTLRYYDQVGLLPPSHHTAAGHRLYTDEDLSCLQQILALKFLGLPLEEIKRWQQTGPHRLPEILALQKAMMQEKRAQIDAVIKAIEETEHQLHTAPCSWDALIKTIQVIQMGNNQNWVKKYFTEEQLKTMEDLSQQSYSAEARQKKASQSPWTEEDQHWIDAQYAQLHTELKRLVASGADPASPEAQAVAKQQDELIFSFTQGDPEIEAGLKNWWTNFYNLPSAQRPLQPPYSDAEAAFLQQVTRIYQQRKAEQH